LRKKRKKQGRFGLSPRAKAQNNAFGEKMTNWSFMR
jgi:hypothetical protein